MDKTRNPSIYSDKRMSLWEDIMRKFSETHKDKCKNVTSLDMPRVKRSVKHFPTGSKYEGTWDVLGMGGFGTYTFPNGVVYEGEMEDGMFHGRGELQYPSGVILRATWKKGHVLQRKLIFADGLEYTEEDWKYCRMPDRRFSIEHTKGLQPAGCSFMTADELPREIPPGYYDTGDGFYDPWTKIVYKADDLNAILRSPYKLEQNWIMQSCRTSPVETAGPLPYFYEHWMEPQDNPEVPLCPQKTLSDLGVSDYVKNLRMHPDIEVEKMNVDKAISETTGK